MDQYGDMLNSDTVARHREKESSSKLYEHRSGWKALSAALKPNHVVVCGARKSRNVSHYFSSEAWGFLLSGSIGGELFAAPLGTLEM